MKHWKRRHGFTLIELLVTVSVMAILLSILIPALGRARSYARQVQCALRLRHLGQAAWMYQNLSGDLLPPHYDRWGPKTFTYTTDHLEPWISYVLYHQDQIAPDGRFRPLQMAWFHHTDLLDSPQSFYCPGQPRDGMNLTFTYDYYLTAGPRSWGDALPLKPGGDPDDKIRASCHYWLHGRKNLNDLARDPVFFDNIQHWNALPHLRNDKPHGLNACFGDGSVRFVNDPDLFDLDLWNGGPAAGPWDGPGNDLRLFNQIIRKF